MSQGSPLPPFKLSPWLKPVIWGGDRIAHFKRIKNAPEMLGESWEVSAMEGKESVVAEGPEKGLKLSQLIEKYGEKLLGHSLAGIKPGDFPILIKFIDAHSDLSLQVHPDNSLASRRHNCQGKTEMWYIIDNDPEARIYAGFKSELDPADYEQHIADGSIVNDVASHHSAPGNIYFLPPGRIHAIGAGNFLIEIQQSSDITYRVYDYGRLDMSGKPRELHVDQARDALNFADTSNYGITQTPKGLGQGMVTLAECEYFRVRRLTVEGQLELDTSEHDSFVTLTCIAGKAWLKCDGHPYMKLNQGETALIPASTGKLALSGNAILISATLPN